ncbi:MAG: hypothetical protein AAF399_30415, partial [Bacteroidota bacterium]
MTAEAQLELSLASPTVIEVEFPDVDGNTQMIPVEPKLVSSNIASLAQIGEFETLYRLLVAEEGGKLVASQINFYGFMTLARSYRERFEAVLDQHCFHKFAALHPGMEHLAGVPKGGTLVLVYTDAATLLEAYDQENLGVPASKVLITQEPLSDLRDQLVFPQELPNVSAAATTVGQQRSGQTDILIADFALPYRTSSDGINVAYVMARPRPIVLLDQLVFCEGDESVYSFILDPAGGTVSGPGVGTDANGQPAFIPADVADGLITFTYVVDGTADTLTVRVKPKAEVEFEVEAAKTCIPFGASEHLIALTPTQDGGILEVSVNGGSSYQVLETVDSDGIHFDVLSLFEEGATALSLMLRYRFDDSEEFCAAVSEPQAMTFVKQPDAQIELESAFEYDDNCLLIGIELTGRNVSSDQAETYTWVVNGVAEPSITSKDSWVEVVGFLQSDRVAIQLIAKNGECANTSELLEFDAPFLTPDWNFIGVDSEGRLPFCQDGQNDTTDLLITGDAGGRFELSGPQETVDITDQLILLSPTNPCEGRLNFRFDYSGLDTGTYEMTYRLPGDEVL